MMLLIKIAFRNLFRQRRRSILTGLSMVVGFTLMSLSMGIQEGGYGHIIDLFTRSHTGHIQLHKKSYLARPSLYKNVEYTADFEQKLQKLNGVKAIAPRIYSGALAFQGKRTTGVKVIGINPQQEVAAMTFKQKIKEGRLMSDQKDDEGYLLNEIIVSHAVAHILKLKLKSEMVLISQGADGSIANDLFTVVGIFGKEQDSMSRTNCYIHINKAQEFLSLGNKVHEVAFVLDHYNESRIRAKEIAATLKKSVQNEFEVLPWESVEAVFYDSMEADKSGNNVFFLIIMMIVAIGVLNTVLMAILERTREFGVLKAIGSRPGTIFILIVLETFFLAIVSTIIGGILSVAVHAYFVIQGIQFPEPVNIGGIVIERMYSAYLPSVFYTPAIVVILTGVIVSLIPAYRASKIKPVDAMRSY